MRYAKRMKADLFVSLHNNGNDKSSIRGTSVIYPNNSLSDYYSVIRNSKLKGFPAVIVEHAYVSNPTDCRNYFSSVSKLRKLGIADAMGIVSYYGLKKGNPSILKSAVFEENQGVKLKWTTAKKMDGYAVYRRVTGEKRFERIALIKGRKNVTYCDSTVESCGQYEYMVRAYHTLKGVSRYFFSENVLSVNVLFAPVGVQATWTRVEQENLSDKAEQTIEPEQTTDMVQRVVLTWEEVCGADGYRIAKRENPGEALSVVAEVSGQAVTAWSEDLPGETENHPQYEVCSYVWVDGVMQCSSYVMAVENFVDNGETEEQNLDLEENIQIAQNE